MRVCKFCGQNKKLIDAHVIPWGFYKHLIPDGEKHDPFLLVSRGSEQRRSKGSYDKLILCADCDNTIGILDNYAQSLLRESKFIEERPKLLWFSDGEYKKFGLFVESVLWRTSISTRNEFENISLGIYEDKAKNKLIEWVKNGHVSTLDYIVLKHEDSEIPSQIYEKNIMLPIRYKLQGINVCALYLPGGYKVIMKFDQRAFPYSLNTLTQMARESDSIPVLVKDNFKNTAEFKMMLEMFN